MYYHEWWTPIQNVDRSSTNKETATHAPNNNGRCAETEREPAHPAASITVISTPVGYGHNDSMDG